MKFSRWSVRSRIWRRYTIAAFGALLLLAAGLAVTPGQANAQSEYFAIFNRLGGKCLDVDVHNLSRDGATVQLWECNNQIQQRWFLQPAGPDMGTYQDYTITTYSYDYRKCLDAHAPDAGKNGGRVQTWACNGQPQQRWTFYRSSRTLVNEVAFLCLDADTNTIHENGTKVQLWACNGEDQQVWTPYFP
jgi:hypothetical protein